MNLIILNGPAGVGKSTIASKIQSYMPEIEVISIDNLRRTMPNYRNNRQESLRLSYAYAEDYMKKYFNSGKTVIIDKCITQSEILDRFIDIADKYGAKALEFILFAEKEIVKQRSKYRGFTPGSLLTPEKVEELWEKTNSLKTQRPKAIVIDTANLSPEAVFNIVIARLDEIMCQHA